MKSYPKLIISVIITLSAGFLGSFFTSSSIDTWYASLNKPSFNPPNWLFVPVWTSLFILIGISFYLVWRKNFGGRRNLAVGVYSIQLSLNLLWSFFFFGLENPFFALMEIILLWAFILANMNIFYKISKPAAFLLLPYLFWVSFALILNYFIFKLN